MFRARTVIILGAGASCEVGLPPGPALLKTVADKLSYRFDRGSAPISGDRVIFEALRYHLNEGREVKQLNEHLLAAEQIVRSAGQAISIDNVIDMLEDEKAALVGKLGIGRAILEAEGSSSYFRLAENRRDLQIAKFSETWYLRLTKIITEGIKRSNIRDTFNNLEIVNFNYDRCLEQYLPHSLSSYYGIELVEAQKLVDGLVVHRPYGRVGRLPWQSGDDPAIEFGSDEVADVEAAAKQLRTFTEQVEEGEALESIRNAIVKADRIIFLGFAFHRQNVKLLSSPRDEMPGIIATCKGISSSDQGVIGIELVESLGCDGLYDGQQVDLFDGTCAELFDNYWRTITAGPPEE